MFTEFLPCGRHYGCKARHLKNTTLNKTECPCLNEAHILQGKWTVDK